MLKAIHAGSERRHLAAVMSQRARTGGLKAVKSLLLVQPLANTHKALFMAVNVTLNNCDATGFEPTACLVHENYCSDLRCLSESRQGLISLLLIRPTLHFTSSHISLLFSPAGHLILLMKMR